MTIWLDAQISPLMALFLRTELQLSAFALKEIGLRDAMDLDIFEKGKAENVIVISKDYDFVELVLRLKSPPKVIWLTCGNTSNDRLKTIFTDKLNQAIQLLSNSDIVELCE